METKNSVRGDRFQVLGGHGRRASLLFSRHRRAWSFLGDGSFRTAAAHSEAVDLSPACSEAVQLNRSYNSIRPTGGESYGPVL